MTLVHIFVTLHSINVRKISFYETHSSMTSEHKIKNHPSQSSILQNINFFYNEAYWQ